jgi:ABC-type hemin transport system ATPase subunit
MSRKAAATVSTPAAPVAEIREPTLTQQLMLDAPWADDLCIVSARGTGKSRLMAQLSNHLAPFLAD